VLLNNIFEAHLCCLYMLSSLPQALSVSFGFPDCNLLKQEIRGLFDNCDGCVKLVQKVNHRFLRLKGDLEA